MARKRLALKVEEWPAPDRAAWRNALVVGDVLEPGGLAAKWAQSTQSNVATCYGRWLGWLASRGGLDVAQSVVAHATRDNLAAYVAHLRERHATSTAATYLAFVAMGLQALAPDNDWSWVQPIIAMLRRDATPVREKRPRLQTADDLFEFGVEMMEAADSGDAASSTLAMTWERATQFRDGSMVALLALRPLRRRNFCSIEIGRHLTHRAGTYWLLFERDETKTKQPIKAPFPPVLVPALEKYLTHYRPWLLKQTGHRDPRYPFRPAGSRLWVSKTGSPLSPEAFYKGLHKRTTARFGRSLCPHLFRDCAATTIAERDAAHVRITINVLGHTDIRTSEGFYNHAQGLEATRKLQDEVLAVRRAAEAADRDERTATVRRSRRRGPHRGADGVTHS